MNILITGAKGMGGTALVNNLKNIRDHKNQTKPNILIGEIYEYDMDSTKAELEYYCERADFVFHLAGVNRPENPDEFTRGNFGFTSELLACLKKYQNKAVYWWSGRGHVWPVGGQGAALHIWWCWNCSMWSEIVLLCAGYT